MHRPILLLGLSAAIAGVSTPRNVQETEGAQSMEPALAWTAGHVEHLYSRAGFGASARDIARALEWGPRKTVDELIEGEGWIEEPFYSRVRGGQEMRERMMRMPEDKRDTVKKRMRREDAAQARDYLGWWMERILEGTDDLRERMTLFWHGHFTSSMQDVKNSHEMILQNQLLRRHALGNFGDMVHGIARDPAMLEYLDNDSNRKSRPNENFARELMELFTLGEGNYTEEDIKEAARAFTGWTDRNGKFRFNRRQHDNGRKTVLGTTGNLDGDDVIDILLEQEVCARYLAGKLLRYFEGIEPPAERVERYAVLLRKEDYEMTPFLRALFLDPGFYRPGIVGGRVASPLDFLVGASRRMGLDPPSRLVLVGAATLGERLFYPPNVKGWEGGDAWITTGSLMQRGNLAGVLLGEVELTDFLDHDPLNDDEVLELGRAPRKRTKQELKELRKSLGVLRELRDVERTGYRPRMRLAGALKRARARTDVDVVRIVSGVVLAIEVDPGILDELTAIFRDMRVEAGLPEGGFEESAREFEKLLRRYCHVLLSLPEAQLH